MWIRQTNETIASDVSQRIDIVTRKGETANFTLKLYDPTTMPGIYNLTGFSVVLTIRAGDTTLASTNVVGSNTGELSFDFTTVQMGFNAGSYSYTITASEGLTYVKTWVQGVISHLPTGGVNSYPSDTINTATRVVRIKEKDIQITFLNN